MKVKTDLKSGNVITNAANEAKSLTNASVDLAKNTWNAAASELSSLWATVTSIF